MNQCSYSPDYFTKILEDDLKSVVKPQYVDQLPKAVKGPTRTVEGLIKQRAGNDNMDKVLEELGEIRLMEFEKTY